MKSVADVASANGHEKLAKALKKGSVGVLLRKEERKNAMAARKPDDPMDIEVRKADEENQS